MSTGFEGSRSGTAEELANFLFFLAYSQYPLCQHLCKSVSLILLSSEHTTLMQHSPENLKRRKTLSRQRLIRSKGASFTLHNIVCRNRYGKGANPFQWERIGASPGKIFILGFLKSAFQYIAFK